MMSRKLEAGEVFPLLTVKALGGGEIILGSPQDGFDWQLVMVYRGKHCPICTRYLEGLNGQLDQLNSIGVDVVAVSADSEDKARAQTGVIAPRYRVGYGLSVEQMKALGLYISSPRSPEETDHPFAEPGLFVINDQGTLQVTDISNAPFARPSLASLAMGLEFIRKPENNYPIRGTLD